MRFPVPSLSPALLCGALFGCEALADAPVDACENLARAVEPDRQGIEATYSASYERRDGNCGDLAVTSMFTPANVITQQRFADGELVETDVTLNGCSAGFSQSISDNGILRVQVFGPELIAVTPHTLTGKVMANTFDNGMQTCAGTYDATLERVTRFLGGVR